MVGLMVDRMVVWMVVDLVGWSEVPMVARLVEL